MGGDNLIVIVFEVNFFKKCCFVIWKLVVKWEFKVFINLVRGDDGVLVLRYWKRRMDDGVLLVEGV